jgi:hypothetical protein
MMKRNPKQEGSNVFDCRPQTGICPNGCNQCFYNRPNAFYNNIDQPSIPSPEEIGTGIVRMNCGHDSNIEKELVIKTAQQYENFFFNTSIPNLDFPGPIVLTVNPQEEESAIIPFDFRNKEFDNIMFVRLRVSSTNLIYIEQAIDCWARRQVPVVLTFMAYYDEAPPGTVQTNLPDDPMCYVLKDHPSCGAAYRWQQRHINSYYCATVGFMEYVTKKMKKIGGRLVSKCGTGISRLCKDCHNCETYYWQTKKHMIEKGLI